MGMIRPAPCRVLVVVESQTRRNSINGIVAAPESFYNRQGMGAVPS